MRPPPIINANRLQHELNALMASYDAFDEERTQKIGEWLGGSGLVFIVGITAMRTRLGGPLALLFFVVALCLLAVSFARFWSRRPGALEARDRRLIELAPQLGSANRLSLSWEHRRRLHDRLFSCSPPVAMAIIQVLEVAGDREGLNYLWGIAGHGIYASLLAERLPIELRRGAATAALSLQRKLELETQAETLLRPSGGADRAELLRPVQGAGHTAANLLRADPVESGD